MYIYSLPSQKIATNPHPVYVKHTDNGDYYLYFRDKGEKHFTKIFHDDKKYIFNPTQRTSCPRAGWWGRSCWRTPSSSPPSTCTRTAPPVGTVKNVTLGA